jgi:prolipoprotein diacylglyceryl transferase
MRALTVWSDVHVLAVIGWRVLDRFHFGSRFAISPHGLGIAVGYLCGSLIFMKEGPKRGVTEEQVSSLVLWGLVGSIVGARVGYVLSHTNEYHSVLGVLEIYKGGISLVGGIVGWVVVAIPIVRRGKFSALDAFDAAAMPLAVGIVIGRVGDLIIGDHLGKPTSSLLAFQYWGGNLAGYACSPTVKECVAPLNGGQQQVITHAGATLFGPDGSILAHGAGVHQTALYDFLLTMGLVLLMVWMMRAPHRRGALTCTFVIWYAGGRVLTDFLRVERRFLGLTGSQWACIGAIILCVGLLVWMRRREGYPLTGGSGAPPPQPEDGESDGDGGASGGGGAETPADAAGQSPPDASAPEPA